MKVRTELSLLTPIRLLSVIAALVTCAVSFLVPQRDSAYGAAGETLILVAWATLTTCAFLASPHFLRLVNIVALVPISLWANSMLNVALSALHPFIVLSLAQVWLAQQTAWPFIALQGAWLVVASAAALGIPFADLAYLYLPYLFIPLAAVTLWLVLKPRSAQEVQRTPELA